MNEMGCKESLERVCDRLDGAPLAVDPSVLEAHLTSCSKCRAEAVLLMKDDARLKKLGEEGDVGDCESQRKASTFFDEQLIARIVKELQTLVTFSPGNVNDRILSDDDLDWLSAAGAQRPEGDAPKKE